MNEHIKYRANKLKYQDTCLVSSKPPSPLPAVPLVQTSSATRALPLLLPPERAGSTPPLGEEQTLAESQPTPRAAKGAVPAAVRAAQTHSTRLPARGPPWEAEPASARAACCLEHRCYTVEQKQSLHFLD